MHVEQVSLSRRLQAVGEIVDRRGAYKEVLVQQADDGFIVHALEATWGHEQSQWSPITIVIEPAELQEALDMHALPAGASGKADKKWWR